MDLGELYKFSKGLGKVDFSELVACSTDHKIIRYDGDDPKHRELLHNLTKALDNFVKSSRKATRFTGNRINDIGSALEETITQEIRKVSLESEKMAGSGYPDLLVMAGDLPVYVEVKSSSTKGTGHKVNHRLFYYSTGKKIKMDALHLLLQIDPERGAKQDMDRRRLDSTRSLRLEGRRKVRVQRQSEGLRGTRKIGIGIALLPLYISPNNFNRALPAKIKSMIDARIGQIHSADDEMDNMGFS